MKTTWAVLSLTFLLCSAVDYNQNEEANSKHAKILNYEFENIGTGPYHFLFSTSDGISRMEEATIVNPNTENQFLVVRGSYSYIGPDGVNYSVTYTADENGFHPQAAHIKAAPLALDTRSDRNSEDNGRYRHENESGKSEEVPAPVYGSSDQKSLVTEYISPHENPNIIQSIAQEGDSKSEPFNMFSEQPDYFAYLPNGQNYNSNEQNIQYQRANVANSILEILGDEDENNEEVKITDINSI